MVKKLTEMQRDVLKEMANIGSGNASTFLSEEIGKEVNVTVSTCDLISFKRLAKLVRASEELVITVFTSIGSTPAGGGEREIGNVMLVFPKEDAFSLIDLLQRKEIGTTKNLSPGNQFILKQVSSSLLRCYLDAIKDFLNLKIQPSKLRLIGTYGESIMDFVLLAMKEKPEKLILLETKMSVEPNIQGKFYFLLKENFLSYLPIKSTERLPATRVR